MLGIILVIDILMLVFLGIGALENNNPKKEIQIRKPVW